MSNIISLTNGQTIPDNRIISIVTASLIGNQNITSNISVIQYDNTLPVVGVNLLTNNNNQYMPSKSDTLCVRMGKHDGKGVVNECLGFDSNGTIYFAVTQQMAAAYGMGRAVIEISNTDGVKSSSVISINVVKNPVQEDQIESENEFKTVTELLQEVQTAIEILNNNQGALDYMDQHGDDITNVSNHTDELQTIADNINNINSVANNNSNITTVATNISDVQDVADNISDINTVAAANTSINMVAGNISNINTAAQNIAAITAAPSYAQNAKNSATLAESWAIGGTGTRIGEDTNNAMYYAQQAALSANGYLGYYSTLSNLQSTHLTGENGEWAIVGEYNTIYIWNSSENEWVGTNNNFYSRDEANATFAPINHQSTSTTYGVGNASYYGHVRVITTTGSTVSTTGYVASNARVGALENWQDDLTAISVGGTKTYTITFPTSWYSYNGRYQCYISDSVLTTSCTVVSITQVAISGTTTDLTDNEKAAGATWTGCNITSGRLTFYSDDNITTQFKLNVVVAIPSVTVTATRGY